MTCAQIQDELLLYVGDELPDDLREHVTACAECRRRWEELSETALALGTDSDFAPDPHMALVIERDVMQRLAAQPRRFSRTLSGLAKIAAAVVLVVGSSYVSYQVGKQHLQSPSAVVVDTSAQYVDSGVYATTDSTQVDIDDNTVSLLIDDYTANVGEPGERLLNDLTTEEMEYLQKNLKAEDLL